jgi:hypothetical protein
MKKNTLSVTINSPIEKLFDFTVNPENTHLWIDFVKKEEKDTSDIHKGTIYRNTSDGETWTEYVCTEYKPDQLFTLKNKNTPYVVIYQYQSIDENTTELTYSEYMSDDSELPELFEQKHLEKLRNILENK